MPEIIVEELALPDRADAPDADDFRALVEIRNTIEVAAFGSEDRRLAPVEILPWWQDKQVPVRVFGVSVDGELAAYCLQQSMLEDPGHLWITLNVLPEHRRQGIGTALLEHAEALATSDGRHKLIIYASSAIAPGERIPSPTGFGSVPASNDEVKFLLGRGYRLEQVERGSRLALPIEVTVPEPAEGYRLHFWQNHTPERWLEDMAHMYTRMSTDAPSAGLEEPEDVHTVERVLEFEAVQATSGRTQLVVVAEHIETGRLVGYTELRVPPEQSRSVSQGDTFVLREHRGHRLGMLLKAANLDRLQREHPDHPAVFTFNAEENRFMLDVNEAVGFVPVGYEGAWRKDI